MMNKDSIQDAALKSVLPFERAGIHGSMGIGKTFLGLKHMNILFEKDNKAFFLVVAPKKAIIKEWVKQAEEHGLDHLIPRMVFTTYLSLPKQHFEYMCIYLDECHSLLQAHLGWLNSYDGMILGLTGTPPRYASSLKAEMVAKFCPIKYVYDTDDAVEDEILNDYRIIVHMIELGKTKTLEVKTKYNHFFTTEEANYNYCCERVNEARTPNAKQMTSIMRMKSMQNYRSKEVYALRLANTITEKCLIFANTQDQANRLCRNSYHSANPLSEENLTLFKQGAITRLSAVLQLSEGVNIPNLKEGIILHSYGNERKAAQRIGRFMRLSVDQTATVHILCYKHTIDEKWVEQALQSFDQSKISFKQE